MTGSRPLTELEIQNLLQTFTGKYEIRNRTLFLLGLNTGTRISELLSLDVRDVWRYKRPKVSRKACILKRIQRGYASKNDQKKAGFFRRLFSKRKVKTKAHEPNPKAII
ncbi:tyrosine-type recombinase/integrase [bacterium]|nr:tyrosine-type recombinase/integrase [bacterium]